MGAPGGAGGAVTGGTLPMVRAPAFIASIIPSGVSSRPFFNGGGGVLVVGTAVDSLKVGSPLAALRVAVSSSLLAFSASTLALSSAILASFASCESLPDVFSAFSRVAVDVSSLV